MRLHDVQVAISALNTADKFHNLNQNQGQLAQSQNAMQINEQANIKLTQAQKAEEEHASKALSEEGRRGKQLKKEKQPLKKAQADVSRKPETDVKSPGEGYIIDIKA